MLWFVFMTTSAAYAAPNTVRRFYNMTNGAHFWSAGGEECANVLATWPGIYRYEGIAWTIDASRVSNPLYRAYNTANGAHFYTTSYAEFAGLPWYFIKEGPSFYFPPASPVINRVRRWPDNTNEAWPRCRVYVNYQLLPDPWKAAAYQARMEWNNAGRSNMYFTFADASGANRIVAADLGSRFGMASTVVEPTPQWSSANMTKATTTINTWHSWSVDGVPGSTQIDLQSTLTHELGHWVMEKDDYLITPQQWWPWATMHGLSSYGATYKRTLAAEDIDGIRWTYGAKP